MLAEVGTALRARCRRHARACAPRLPADGGRRGERRIVNAIQRRAHVVVQKSLAEGFGLTVAEAMWKGRPVVATRVGGIQDQIVDGVTGVLVDDPLDLARFRRACDELLEDRERADRIGAAAREWVIERFLGSRRCLVQYLRLLDDLLSGRTSSKAGALSPEIELDAFLREHRRRVAVQRHGLSGLGGPLRCDNAVRHRPVTRRSSAPVLAANSCARPSACFRVAAAATTVVSDHDPLHLMPPIVVFRAGR